VQAAAIRSETPDDREFLHRNELYLGGGRKRERRRVGREEPLQQGIQHGHKQRVTRLKCV
jgi:hypothetical protein